MTRSRARPASRIQPLPSGLPTSWGIVVVVVAAARKRGTPAPYGSRQPNPRRIVDRSVDDPSRVRLVWVGTGSGVGEGGADGGAGGGQVGVVVVAAAGPEEAAQAVLRTSGHDMDMKVRYRLAHHVVDGDERANRVHGRR